MATIAEVRQKYPQYADMSDEELGKALHAKYYSDIPWEQFAEIAGMPSRPRGQLLFPGDRGISRVGEPVSEEEQRQRGIAAARAAHPIAARVQDFSSGMLGLARGALNRLSEGIGNRLPAMPQERTLSDLIAPTTQEGLGDRLLPQDFVDKSSGAYLFGSLADPVAWGTGIAAAKALPYAKVLGSGFKEGAKAFGRNVAGGAIPGAAVGTLSDDGTVGGGAAIGAAANVVLPPAIAATGRLVGRAISATNPQEKAARILREVAGSDIGGVQAAAANAPEGITAAQATAGLKNDVLSALGRMVERSDRENFFSRLAENQRQDQLDKLRRLAGGATQTEARQTTEASRRNLNAVTGEMRRTELEAANTAGKVGRKLEAKADRFGGAASSKVEDVRRLEAAKAKAEEIARTGRMGLGGEQTPVLGREGLEIANPPPYSRGAELTDIAERGSQKAADDSLLLGAAARDAKSRAESIAAHGLSPLNTDGVVSSLARKLNSPSIGVSDINRKVISRVAKKINEWKARGNGVIDAQALYEIRKGAVNEEIERLMRGADPKAQAKRAASLLAEIKPLIDDAIEEAGGTGWRNYLTTFSEGSEQIARQKLASAALQMFEKSPRAFVDLVRGNAPKLVKKITGSEEDFDLVVGPQARSIYETIADDLARDMSIRKGAARGEGGLQQVLEENVSRFKLPNWLSGKIAVTNRALDMLETRMNKKTMAAIREAMKSGRSLDELLSIIPAEERNKFVRAMYEISNSPTLRGAATAVAAQ